MGLFLYADDGRRRAIGTILLVEDEPLIADANILALAQAGYDVLHAPDFAEAVAMLAEREIDLLIADICLSGPQSGVDVARLARDRGIPVLFSAGACPEEAEVEALALGWLAKPYGRADLVRAVHAMESRIVGTAPEAVPVPLRLFEPAFG